MEKELIIYTKQGCPYCYRLMSILRDRKIKFREVDVYSDDEDADKAVVRNGKKPVPQAEFNGRIIYDYTNEEELVDEIEEYTNTFKG